LPMLTFLFGAIIIPRPICQHHVQTLRSVTTPTPPTRPPMAIEETWGSERVVARRTMRSTRLAIPHCVTPTTRCLLHLLPQLTLFHTAPCTLVHSNLNPEHIARMLQKRPIVITRLHLNTSPHNTLSHLTCHASSFESRIA
jgi:hypothetical protein